MTSRLAVLAFVATGALALPATAQTWQAPPPAVSRLGVVTVACKGEFCLGVACRGGRSELVSMSPGGGPFDGPTLVSFPGTSATITFTEDPKIMDALNMMGTRGPIATAILARMAGQRAITLSGGTLSDKMTSTFSLNGYAKFAPAVAKACGLPAGGSLTGPE